jgi:hypothetical protein
MPDLEAIKTKQLSIQSLINSNISRIAFFLLIFGLYYFFVSPYLEDVLITGISRTAQSSSTMQVNALSPVFDIHTYSAEYKLSSNIAEDTTTGMSTFITIDPRVLAMDQFLNDYHSPMAPYAKFIVETADSYGLDWRLVVAISGVESSFGNIVPGGDSNNAWGWRGINKNAKGWSVFATWEDGIAEITRGLAEGYGTTLVPEEIEPSYCPPCAESGHAWARGVNKFMNELDYYVDNLDNN